jgi:L-aminopeptidase/D-esterase-like protein
MHWHQLGLAIGHASDTAGGTGCTVIRGIEQPFRCAAALLGRASGTRELATCLPEHLVDRTDALLLTGGSAYGLDAASGVMRWMEERGRGFPVGSSVIPIVPAAVIFDLEPVGRPDARPDAAMAYAACDRANSNDIAEGSVGAGTGALVGKVAGLEYAMKGGVGVAHRTSRNLVASALAVVNAFGDVRDADGRIIAGARDRTGSFIDSRALLENGASEQRLGNASDETAVPRNGSPNTTLAVIAISTPISKQELAQVALAATAALHRRVSPGGTQFDGDVIFAVCPFDAPAVGIQLAHIESLAVAVLEDAIERGVRSARGRDGYPGLADHD